MPISFDFIRFGIITLFIIISGSTQAQEKYSVNVGIGYPDLIHVGFRVLHEQHEFGFNFGRLSHEFATVNGFSLDYYVHFRGESIITERMPVFIRLGLHFLDVDDHRSIEKTLSFHPRIGRDINFSPSLGLQVDLGPALLLYQENKDNSGMEIETHGLELSWSASLGLFYKI